MSVSPTRDRLLLAAAELLHASADKNVSTRAICERAGVQAPTLYHHFGSKKGLLDAVVDHGFTQYVQARNERAATGDPLARIRAGWDDHVRFGLAHPSFYVLLYGQIQPGVPCTITASAEAMLVELLTAVARQGRLRVPPAEAARQLVAANVGVTLSMIAQPGGERDEVMSPNVRDAVLAALVTGPEDAGPGVSGPGVSGPGVLDTGAPGIGALAIALSAALDEGTTTLSASENSLLHEWLRELATNT
jgi:AcrR family transcriptional regulator